MNYLVEISTGLLFTSMIVLPQSFFFLKFSALCFYLIAHGGLLLFRSNIFIQRSDVLFYTSTCLIGVVWSLVGILNGNLMGGVYDGMKLYVAWSFLFFLMLTMRRNAGAISGLHSIFVVSTLLIFLVNIASLVDVFFRFDLLPVNLIKELGLQVGLHDQYIKLHGNNIASLLFLVAYLITHLILKKEHDIKQFWNNLALVLGLLLVFISGRRALWGVVLLMPIIVYIVTLLSGNSSRLRYGFSKIFTFYIFSIFSILLGFAAFSIAQDNEIITYFLSAFSDEDERSIQKVYLWEGFTQQPWLGSGFGGYAGYTRSELSPWLYELTYHQIIFNFGIIGVLFITFIFSGYVLIALKSIRYVTSFVNVRIGILSGFICYLLGSYSNPYLQFFDSMLFIMLFVLIAEKRNNIR